MGFAPPSAGFAPWGNPWQQQAQQQAGQPQFMMPPSAADPNFLMAHQQAMMYAKQAYQMAVARQALAAAGEEWERGSNASFGSSLGMGGMLPQPGFGGGGPAGFGMGMMGGGMGPMQGGWGAPSMMFPPQASPRSSLYATAAFSDIGLGSGGGGGASGGWASRSAYGESFGPSAGDRSSMAFRGSGTGGGNGGNQSAPMRNPRQEQGDYFGTPSMQSQTRLQNHQGSRSQGAAVGKPRQRTISVPAISTSSLPRPSSAGNSSAGGNGRTVPPSSWKLGQTKGL